MANIASPHDPQGRLPEQMPISKLPLNGYGYSCNHVTSRFCEKSKRKRKQLTMNVLLDVCINFSYSIGYSQSGKRVTNRHSKKLK